MKMASTTSLLVLTLAMSGCASLEPVNTRIQPTLAQTSDHIQELAQGPASATTSDKDLIDASGRFRSRLKIASADNATEDQIKQYLDSGITVVNLYCREFFRQISASAAHRAYLSSEVNDFGGFISAVLGLTNAGSLATGATGALFGLLDSSIKNYDASYMVSPDLPSIERLVIRSQSTLAEDLLAADRTYTYPKAERALADYANTCTFNGIKSLANESVNAADMHVENNILKVR